MVYLVELFHRSNFRYLFGGYIKEDIFAGFWHVMYLSLKVEGMSLWFFLLTHAAVCWECQSQENHLVIFFSLCTDMPRNTALLHYQPENIGKFWAVTREAANGFLLFSLLNEESLGISVQCNSCWFRVLMPPVLVKDNFLLSSLQLLLRFMPSPLKYWVKRLPCLALRKRHIVK